MKAGMFALSFVVACCVSGVASAESFEELCLRVSDEWGSTGDVAAQCSCLAEMTAADASLDEELTTLAEIHTSDADAYDSASDEGKAALDACAVET